MQRFVTSEIPEGLTFDDVLLIPARSEVLPRDVDVTTRFTRDITIHTPIVSAAMDTVTEADLAIAMARAGGIGVIHKNMTIEAQCEQVRRVKRAENGMIYDPVTIAPDATVGEALAMMAKHHIGGIPVVDGQGYLIGIVTNRDLRFHVDNRRPVSEIMTKENLITARKGISLTDATDMLMRSKVEKLPVVDENNRLVGLITYKDLMKIKDNPIASKDSRGRLLVAAAVGVKSDTIQRIEMLQAAGADAVVIDTAHGHSAGVLDVIAKTCKAFSKKDIQIVAGNVATAEGAKALADAGVDAVKVGIGPGSICTTRIIAGVGMPQLTAVMMAAEALKGSGVPTIMAGSLFAGTEESPGETIILSGRKFKSYRGMGSLEAMENGSKDRYFQDMEADIKKLVPEGIVSQVPYKGSVAEVVYQLVGGLRAGMGYVGAGNIEALRNAKFVRITHAGFVESHPHDVTITKEAPNYSR